MRNNCQLKELRDSLRDYRNRQAKGSAKRTATNQAIKGIGPVVLLNQLYDHAKAKNHPALCETLAEYRWICFEWVLEAMDAAGYLESVSIHHAANKHGGA